MLHIKSKGIAQAGLRTEKGLKCVTLCIMFLHLVIEKVSLRCLPHFDIF